MYRLGYSTKILPTPLDGTDFYGEKFWGICIRTVPGCIGVGKAIKGVTVAGFDGIEPSLFDREAKAGMIKSNQGTGAGKIEAAQVKWGTCGPGCQGDLLGCAIQVVDQAGSTRSAGSQDALAGMMMIYSHHGRRVNHWGWRGRGIPSDVGVGSGDGAGMGG